MTEVQQGPSYSTCLLQRGVRFNEVSIKRQLTLHVKRVLQLLELYQDFLNNPQFNTQIVACVHLPFTPQKLGEGFLHAGYQIAVPSIKQNSKCFHLFLRTYSQCFFLWLRHHSNPRWLVEYEVWWKESVRIRSVVCCSPIAHYPLCCTYQCLPSGHSQRIDGLCIGKWKLIDLTCSSHKCWLITVWR